MPLETIALLKEISELYDFPNSLTIRLPTLHLEEEDSSNMALMLHFG